MLRFRFRSGDVGIEGDKRPSRGIGMPVSKVFEEEYEDVEGEAE
jgi:hypothetical protein